jgi:hypothetical protein
MTEIADELTASDDLSSSRPMVKWSEEWWATAKPEVRARRCKAHKKDGSRCAKASMENQRVCGTHGGRARHSMEAARRRLMENADPAVKQLTEIAYDTTKSDDIRLKATLALIDRAGLTPKAVIEVGPTKQFETVFDQFEAIESGPRSDFRHAAGIDDDSIDQDNIIIEATGVDLARHLGMKVEDDDEAPIDVEIVDTDADTITPADDERGSPFDSEPWPSPFAPATPPPSTALMPYDAAVSAAAQLRRSVVSHRAQRI